VRLDRASLTVEVLGDRSLRDVDAELARHGLTLGVEHDMTVSVSAWIAEGAPGARDPWIDPVDHLVAGFEARFADGTALRVRPGPRRAVGPDLFALFFGMRGRFGEITRAHLRVHPKGTPGPETARFLFERDTRPNDGENALLEKIAVQLSAISPASGADR
jgi:alkyldihydroxyacetonephosphate synthase